MRAGAIRTYAFLVLVALLINGVDDALAASRIAVNFDPKAYVGKLVADLPDALKRGGFGAVVETDNSLFKGKYFLLGRKIDSRTVLFLTKRADPKDKAQERIVAVLLYRLKSSEALSVDCKPSSGFGSVVGVVQDTVGGLYMSVRAAWKVDFEHEQIRSIPPISVKCMPNGSGD